MQPTQDLNFSQEARKAAAAEYDNVVSSMHGLGLSDTEMQSICAILAVVLELGNITIGAKRECNAREIKGRAKRRENWRR